MKIAKFQTVPAISRQGDLKWYELNPRRLKFRKLAVQSPFAELQKKLNFSRFVGTGKILILDPSSLGRSALAGLLTSLGAKSSQILLASTVSDALEFLSRETPVIFLGEDQLSRSSRVSVFERFRSAAVSSDRFLSVMMTADVRGGSIAEAARVDADFVVAKPFSMKSLKDALTRKIHQKLHQPEYSLAIRKSQELILEGDLASAVETFQQARAMDPARTAAGLTGRTKENYQCLSRLYDVLLKQKNYNAAYQVIRKMMPHFSGEAERITELFRLAIVTENHEDLIEYYPLFVEIQNRSEKLSETVSSSYIFAARACARKATQPGMLKLMQDLLMKAYLSSSPREEARVRLLRQIIVICVQNGFMREAKLYLRKIPGDYSSDSYQAMEYFIASQKRESGEVIDRGWKLLSKGVQDPIIYEVLIARLVARGKLDPAEHLAYEAARLWPEQSDKFRSLAVHA